MQAPDSVHQKVAGNAPFNPYKRMIFPADSVDKTMELIATEARRRAAQTFSKKSEKNHISTISGFMSNFAVKPVEYRQSQVSERRPSFLSDISTKQKLLLSTDGKDRKTENNSLLTPGTERSKINAEPDNAFRGPDPSVIIQIPQDHEFKPPKLWDKVVHEPTPVSSPVEEKIPTSAVPAAPPVKRKRGRPRKNPLPDPDEYAPKQVPKPRKQVNIEPEIVPEPLKEVAQVEVSPKCPPSRPQPIDKKEPDTDADVNEPMINLPPPRSPKDRNIEFPDSPIEEICGQKKNEFLVKMKGKSYRDVEWVTRDQISEIENGDEILRCFEYFGIRHEEPYFNPVFTEPDRVIDERDGSYLVKWKTLGYKYATWETEADTELLAQYEALKSGVPTNLDSPPIISVTDMFYDTQQQTIDELYQTYVRKGSCSLYGNIGSILRLELTAVISMIKQNHGIVGPHLIIADESVVELVVDELLTYTDLSILTVSGDDEDEFNAIKETGFVFRDGKPKFNIVVVSETLVDRFMEEMPHIRYAVAAVDGSEIYRELPSLEGIDADLSVVIRKRTDEELEIESHDDSSIIHDELTLFCPMLKEQREMYFDVLRENADLLTLSNDKLDKSRLYEAATKLKAIATFPSMMNAQHFMMKSSRALEVHEFTDCGKLRVLQQLMQYARDANQRLMIVCRDQLLLDVMEMYCTAANIEFVRVGVLSVHRVKLELLSTDAKNKRIVILSQFNKTPINWLSLTADIIVVLDGIYNPMNYFVQARRSKKRDCLIIRLLSADTHEGYLAACADHYEEDEEPVHIFRAAASKFMRPIRERIERDRKYAMSTRFNATFCEYGINFQYLFDDHPVFIEPRPFTSPKFSRSDSRRQIDRSDTSPRVSRTSSIKLEPAYEQDNNKVHRPHQRKRVNRYRLPKGTNPPAAPSHGGSVVVRRHRRHKGTQDRELPPLAFVECPHELSITGSDHEYVWTSESINILFMAMTRYAWGQWIQFEPFVPNVVSACATKDCCYAILAYLVTISEAALPFTRRAVSDYSLQLSESNYSIIPEAISSNSMYTIEKRLQMIEYMIRISLLISLTHDPLSEIEVFEIPETQPTEQWTAADDRHLLWSCWQYGMLSFIIESDVWPVSTECLMHRFFSELDESEQFLWSAQWPDELSNYHVPVTSMSEKCEPALHNIIINYGLMEVSEIVALLGRPASSVVRDISPISIDPGTVLRIEFFEHLRAELARVANHWSEDLQFMEAVSTYGIEKSHMSPLITKATETENPTFADLRRVAISIFEDTSHDSQEKSAPLDSLGGMRPTIPFEVSPNQRILEFGVIQPNEDFHNSRYIYPLGFTSEVVFPSLTDKDATCVYQCSIGENSDRICFRVACGESVFEGESADAVWGDVITRVNELRGTQLLNPARAPGHELFGLAAPITLRVLQAMDGVASLERYVPRAFKTPYFVLQKRGLIQ